MPTIDQFREFMAAQAKATEGPWEAPPTGFDIVGPELEPAGSPYSSRHLIVKGEITQDDLSEVAAECSGGESYYTISSPADRALIALARSLPVAELLAERERMAEAMRETADELRKWVRLSGLQWPAKLAAKLESALNEQGAGE